MWGQGDVVIVDYDTKTSFCMSDVGGGPDDFLLS